MRVRKGRWLRPLLPVAALTLGGGALRFAALGAESLWYDEAWTWDCVTGGLRHAFERPQRDVHPPLYFVLLNLWMRLGASEAMLRAPSALFGTLTIPLVYALGAILAGRRAGLGAAALFAVSTFQIRYAQEARSYALLAWSCATLATGAAWLLVHPREAARRLRPRGAAGADGLAWASWTACALGAAVALLSHNTAVLFVAGVLGAGLALAPRGLRLPLARNAALAAAVALLLVSWWIPVLWSQARAVGADYWIPAPTAASVADALAGLLGGAPFASFAGARAAVVAVFAGLGAVALRRAPRRAAFLLALALATPLLALAASCWRPIFLARILIVSGAPLCVLAALGPRALPRGAARVAGALVLAAAALTALPGYYAADKKPAWERLAAHVAARARAGDAILVLPAWGARPLRHYYEPTGSGGAAWLLLDESEYERADRLARPYARVFAVGAHLWLAPDAQAALERAGRGRPRLAESHWGAPSQQVVLVEYGPADSRSPMD